MSLDEIKKGLIRRLLSAYDEERVHAAVVLIVTCVMGVAVIVLSAAQAKGKDQVGALAIVVPAFCGFGAYAWKKGKDGEATSTKEPVKEVTP